MQLVGAERTVGLESILKAQGAAHIGLDKPDPHPGNARDTILPPPVYGLRVEEIDDATVPCPGDGDTGCQRIVEQRVVLAIVHDGTDVQSEHVDMLGIDGVDHGLWILERGAELERAASVAKGGIEEPPGGVEPQEVEGDALAAHTADQIDRIGVAGHLLMLPCAAAIGAQMQSVGRTGHQRTGACELLVVVDKRLNVGPHDDVIVKWSLPHYGRRRHIPLC